MKKYVQNLYRFSTVLVTAIVLQLSVPGIVTAQIDLPLTFEGDDVTAGDFEGMRGSEIEIVANPSSSDLNDSENVGKFIKGDQQPFAGFRFPFANPFQADSEDESRMIKMKVWSPRAEIEVRLELQSEEDGNQALFDTVWTAEEWVQLEFDLSEVNPEVVYNRLFQTYDWDGGPGDGTPDWIWYFDDIEIVDDTGVSIDDDKQIPTGFTLSQNYPNPFNPTTNIQFGLPNASHVTLDVYNMLGQKITTIVDRMYSEGIHSVTFDASNLSSGIYIYKIHTRDGFEKTNKMMLIK